MAEEQYDLVILGGGTAGYVAGIRASQLGKKVAIVENQLLGGTCLHKGCIPTKSLLKSAEVLHTVKTSSLYGIDTDEYSINYSKILDRKDEIVKQMYTGIEHLMKHNHIDIYNGNGRILGSSIFSPRPGTISVEYENGESELIPNDYVLIATGSQPAELPFLKFNHKTIVSSTDLLKSKELPNSIVIVGGGVIGIEFASLLNDFGTDVTVIEAGESILPNENKSIVSNLKDHFAKRGIKIHENVLLSEDNIKINNESIEINNNELNVTADKLLLAVGRKPNTSDIGLNNTKIKLDSKGFIEVNENQQTAEQHIFAAGDCIGKLQLAHAGSKEGTAAVEFMFEDKAIPVDYNTIPRCIYSYPEIASIGMTLDEAKKADIKKARVFKIPFKAIGKAVIEDADQQDGFCEIVVDQSTDSVLGLSMIGPHVTELINEIALLQFMNGSTLELGLTTHAHPSLSEVLMEAGLKASKRSVHA
ncbi:dihydrolipoyl dehydrogenase [Staphylococcus condimenti]|uniref:Dihydrolipoyl dehydrogenase n=1 Tax=Staphylococcus condimenti TaxID=70255 RepID=A0AB37H1S7_9STAP|nr:MULTISPECIES: dihydrolipoyl dehydrogenase [Staphylococcus]AMY04714.1 dihydrolipoyl dehydrogenase [Staphylococcus condimenti]APR60956.1 dihydrolipoyl dehydrogenase [Staphylococcus condimenti]MDK8643984.1 dihydrolipoyl dehydrogenase [Staphylococcus condimenti]OFP01303.1 dihydrolipoyl dehydrogenase [Staphylococcus sp. HMSC065E08]PNZ58746.1 dihydrolipoyl dehydrogenase [Staphylococcus condimenti]